MFSYYGAKTKIVDVYPPPEFPRIVEPFAGSARYALKYFDRDVTLYEVYPKVFAVWEYLIRATKNDILALPDLKVGDDIRNFHLSDAEKWLIGYQLQRGNARPGCIVNARCRWNHDKIRIANEVQKVKHWRVFMESGLAHEWREDSTYFVDPPYTVQKHGYAFGSIDYKSLAARVHSHRGQIIVCGNSDDKWLDFQPIAQMRGTKKTHIECMYYKSAQA